MWGTSMSNKVIELFGLAGLEVNRSEISNWLKQDDDPEFEELNDRELATFLNGLIVDKRGKKEGPQPIPESRLNNNLILKKLKIALNLKSEDLIEIFALMDRKISTHEVGAFLRNPKQGKYKPFNDQYFRNFLRGLQKKFRD